MGAVASFWMVGSLFSASLGWALIPHIGWRPFVLVASLPAWSVVALVLAVLPESPRWGGWHSRLRALSAPV